MIMNYDYSGLINLALVTIIYSSFIAPSLKKLGDLREEIANTDFPVIDYSDKDHTKATDIAIDQNGTLLDKKLTQYADKHHEINVFLYFFYTILIIIFGVQICLMFYINSYPVGQIVSLSSAALIITLLIVSIYVYMVPSWKLRSFRWLADKGVAVVYTNRLLKAELILNGKTTNADIKQDGVNLVMRQKAKFIGYKYILLIEGKNHKRLYYIAAGNIGKNTKISPLVYGNGEIAYEYTLAKTRLKDGEYSSRLLIFNAPYGGKYKVSETNLDFSVSKSAVKEGSEPVAFETTVSNYEFNSTRGIKFHITKMIFDESLEDDANVLLILSSTRMKKLMNKLKRPFVMESDHGTLDRYELEKRLSRLNVLKAKIRRFISIGKKKNRNSYHLRKK